MVNKLLAGWIGRTPFCIVLSPSPGCRMFYSCEVLDLIEAVFGYFCEIVNPLFNPLSDVWSQLQLMFQGYIQIGKYYKAKLKLASCGSPAVHVGLQIPFCQSSWEHVILCNSWKDLGFCSLYNNSLTKCQVFLQGWTSLLYTNLYVLLIFRDHFNVSKCPSIWSKYRILVVLPSATGLKGKTSFNLPVNIFYFVWV